VYVGSDDGNVYALNAKTGALRWSYAAASYVLTCSPAVANSVVYAGSYAGPLVALNALTGALLWSGSNIEGSSPTVVGGVVYTGTNLGEYQAYSLP
jgi:outer membrane protein assembly factor BamB